MFEVVGDNGIPRFEENDGEEYDGEEYDGEEYDEEEYDRQIPLFNFSSSFIEEVVTRRLAGMHTLCCVLYCLPHRPQV